MRKDIVPTARITGSIHLLRGQKVLLDFDLAALYGVATKVLNQAVKRNATRFPGDFMFQLSRGEVERISQIVTASRTGHHSRSQIVTLKRGPAIIDAIRQLMAPPPKPKREIGFHVRETAPRYRTRRH